MPKTECIVAVAAAASTSSASEPAAKKAKLGKCSTMIATAKVYYNLTFYNNLNKSKWENHI